jgi:hypothetical protein
MNLTTPPPVEDLDPNRADQLRSNLVTMARKTQHETRRATWVPMLAAACGIAVIATSVVVLAQSGESGPSNQPTPTAPTSAPSPAEAMKVPAAKSARVSLDLGPASIAEARATARQCLEQRQAATGAPNRAAPADADSATVHQARWFKTIPGQGGQVRPAKDRALMQTFTTKKGVWFQCVDADIVNLFDPVLAGIPRKNAVPVNVADPVNGQWTFADVPDGKSTLLFADFTFTALPTVARVEIRIRWTGGASPWYGVLVTAGEGYVAASQPGAVHQRRAMEVDVRAFDRDGRQIDTFVEYG